MRFPGGGVETFAKWAPASIHSSLVLLGPSFKLQRRRAVPVDIFKVNKDFISLDPYSSSLLSSSSSSAAAFLAVFFFFFRFLFLVEVLPIGCSRILRTSSSVIFLSVLYLERSGDGGAAILVMPFLVTAIEELVRLLIDLERKGRSVVASLLDSER